MTDLLTFGETMLQLSPPDDARLETTRQYEVRIGGAESNVAVAASRLGMEVAWASKLPDSPLGRFVVNEVRGQGVEPIIVWSNDGRQGLYFIERGPNPRRTEVIYDRDDAAITTLTAAELPRGYLEKVDAIFTTGITPALSPILAETTEDVFRRAHDSGTSTVLDINYRSKLWSPSSARETLEELFPVVDILVIAERDAKAVFGRADDPQEIASSYDTNYEFELIVITRGSDGVFAHANGETYDQSAFETDDTYPIGTGDTFIGAFLARYLVGAAIPDALEFGAAAAALKRAVPGDLAVITPEEVRRVIEEGGGGIAR